MEITLEKLMALARQKAPIVGIPRLGDKPLALSRLILASVLAGLTVCQITLTDELEIHAERRHYRLRSLDMRRGSEHYRTLKAWAAHERKKKATAHLSREDRRKAELLRKIAVAERKASQMAIHYRPYNLALEWGEPPCEYEREQWTAWYAQMPMRRKIGRIAVAHGLNDGYVDGGIRDPRILYQSLAALTGQEVRKYGELRTTRRSEKPSEGEYLTHLYEYAGNGLESKPNRSRKWRTPEHMRLERLDYCQRLRDWRNAVETVNWLRTQLECFEPANPECHLVTPLAEAEGAKLERQLAEIPAHLERLKKSGLKLRSVTDPASRFLKARQGFTLGYTVTLASSEDGLVVEQRTTQGSDRAGVWSAEGTARNEAIPAAWIGESRGWRSPSPRRPTT